MWGLQQEGTVRAWVTIELICVILSHAPSSSFIVVIVVMGEFAFVGVVVVGVVDVPDVCVVDEPVGEVVVVGVPRVDVDIVVVLVLEVVAAEVFDVAFVGVVVVGVVDVPAVCFVDEPVRRDSSGSADTSSSARLAATLK